MNENHGAMIVEALIEKIIRLEDTITGQRAQIADMDKCIKSMDEDRMKACAERDEWRKRALEAEEDIAMGAAMKEAHRKARELGEKTIPWNQAKKELEKEQHGHPNCPTCD